MEARRKKTYSTVLVGEITTLSLGELCRSCNTHAELVIEMVEYGVLDPKGKSPQDWQFTGESLRRSQTALRLQRDLGINLAGAALVLDLLDELRELRSRVR